MIRTIFLKLALAAALGASAAAAPAQVRQVDPNDVAGQEAPQGSESAQPEWVSTDPGPQADGDGTYPDGQANPPAWNGPQAPAATVPRKDVFTAAEGVFGKGTEGLGNIIEDLLRKQGEPTAYITGREAGGAFVVGARYGSGTLHHQIEGDRPIHWTGPSVGFDFGADAAKVFVLVYNLHDSQRIFRRYPAAEGNAYVVGGFTRRGDVVLIPIRLGVGARLGVNAGYMRFSEKTRWLPF
jgi:hypothetical protein